MPIHFSTTGKRRFSLTCRRVGCLLLLIPLLPILIFVAFISILSPPLPAVAPPPLPADFMKGVSYEAWTPGEFSGVASDQTLRQVVVPSGANWIAVIVKCFQDSTTATDIRCTGDPRNSSDDDLRHVIQQAHARGLKVMLKPHLDPLGMVSSNDGRFNIGFGSG